MRSRDQISAIEPRDTGGMHVATTEHKCAQEENHRGDHEICDDDVFEIDFSVYTSSTTQIMHIKTMIPNQARNISSPHGRADSTSNRACTSTDNCARRAGDEETTSAAEASSSQNRAAADRYRGDNSQHQLHGCFPREEDYRPQPLKVGESRPQRPTAKLESWCMPAEHLRPHLCIWCGQRRTMQMRSTPILGIGAVERCAIVAPKQRLGVRCGRKGVVDVQKEFSAAPAPRFRASHSPPKGVPFYVGAGLPR